MCKGLSLLLVAGLSCLVGENVSLGQGLVRDYVINVPRQYGPRDPWEIGIVMRHQTGHSGLFYNCDCEEHKRLSPYIHWEQQPTVCCPHGHCWDIKQQIHEVQQRIRTGSCKQSEFCLCPRCSSSEPPVRSTCPEEFSTNGGCPTCAAAARATPPSEPSASADESTSKSTGGYGTLFQSR